VPCKLAEDPDDQDSKSSEYLRSWCGEFVVMLLAKLTLPDFIYVHVTTTPYVHC